MNGNPFTFELTPDAFWRWGRAALVGALVLGLALVLLLAWNAPMGLLAVPVALLAGVALWYLFQHPLLNLVVVLSSFVLILSYEEGFQVTEVVYGLYYLTFLGHWFTTRLFFYRKPLLETIEEKALALFLVLMTLSLGITALFGGSLRAAVSEWISLSLFAFYFPVKELCARHRHGPKIVLAVIGWICLFVAVRNMFNYEHALQSATYAWQIAKGRVNTNDILLFVASTYSLTFLIHVRKWKGRLLLLAGFCLAFVGLILTQSRGYWITFFFGAGILVVLIDARRRKRLLVMSALGGGVLFLISSVFFGDYVLLVLGGLFRRLASLQTAFTEDISLINRFYESAAVWEHIKNNPIIGYGMGTSFHVFDIIAKYTNQKSFIHNGYLLLWYKFGLWGLSLVVFFWLRAAWRGVQVFRLPNANWWLRIGSLAAAVSLFAITLSANTSSPFHQNDPPFFFALMMGFAGGAYKCARREGDPASSPS